MDYESKLRSELVGLSPRARVMFAAACVERARALYDSVIGDDSDWFFDAMYVIWMHALDKPYEADELARRRADAQQRHDRLMDDEDQGYVASAIRSLMGAMDSVSDDGIDSAETAAMFAIDAATGTTFDDAHGDEAEREEEEFQFSVLDILNAAPPHQLPELTAFGPLGWKDDEGWPDPRWLTRYEEDEAW